MQQPSHHLCSAGRVQLGIKQALHSTSTDVELPGLGLHAALGGMQHATTASRPLASKSLMAGRLPQLSLRLFCQPAARTTHTQESNAWQGSAEC